MFHWGRKENCHQSHMKKVDCKTLLKILIVHAKCQQHLKVYNVFLNLLEPLGWQIFLSVQIAWEYTHLNYIGRFLELAMTLVVFFILSCILHFHRMQILQMAVESSTRTKARLKTAHKTWTSSSRYPHFWKRCFLSCLLAYVRFPYSDGRRKKPLISSLLKFPLNYLVSQREITRLNYRKIPHWVSGNSSLVNKMFLRSSNCDNLNHLEFVKWNETKLNFYGPDVNSDPLIYNVL